MNTVANMLFLANSFVATSWKGCGTEFGCLLLTIFCFGDADAAFTPQLQV
jgi:hypothetical protein